MNVSRSVSRIAALVLFVLVTVVLLIASPSRSPIARQGSGSQDAAAARFRGKKLMLKDGTSQVVRDDYEIKGDRVRYYSIERGDWEEIPAAMVDWDETKKIADEEKKRDDALLAKVKTQEQAHREDQPFDVDASYQVAPGIFLKSGEGMFAFDEKEKTVTKLLQTDTYVEIDKAKMAAKMITHLPVPTTRVLSIKGSSATFRSASGQLEFYLRTTDANEPNLEVIRVAVHKKTRRIERIDELFGEQLSKKDVVVMQQWRAAKGLFRMTLGEHLTPGEYVVAQIFPGETTNVIFWDFGVDGETAPAPKKK